MKPSPDGQHHAREAAEFLARADFFCPGVDPASLVFHRRDRFEFASPVCSDVARNDTVPGIFERAGKQWRDKPSVILLHGWNAELQYDWHFPFLAQLLARSGLNSIRFELPFHASRKPEDRQAIRNFLSGNLLHVVRATHQTLAEVRALNLWLRQQGSPAVGVWGVSLGAWLSGLALAHQPELNFGVLLTPVVRMDRAFQELAFCDPIREQIAGAGVNFAGLNLVSHAPRCAPEAILLVTARHDVFAPPDTIEELEHSWRAEVWRHAHGHISILASPRTMRRIVKWIRRHSELRADAAV